MKFPSFDVTADQHNFRDRWGLRYTNLKHREHEIKKSHNYLLDSYRQNRNRSLKLEVLDLQKELETVQKESESLKKCLQIYVASLMNQNPEAESPEALWLEKELAKFKEYINFCSVQQE